MTSLQKIIARLKNAEHAFMVALAVVVGLVGGFGAVLFRKLITAVQRLAWGDWTFSLDLVRSHPGWWIVLMPALGGLVVGPLVYFFAREAKGHGVPEVMEAVALKAGVIRPRLVVVKSLASAITIGTGGSVGREGPIVQIGSALGSTLGQWFKLSGPRLKTLVGCGAAAGIAATFNAPIAGALFAVEVILGDFGVRQFSPIVISSVVATVVSRFYLGDFPAFIVPEYAMRSAWELPIYMVLGAIAALVALAFVRTLYKFEDLWDAIPMAPWLKAPIGGLMVGGIGLFFPQVFGVGYEAIDEALRGEMVLGLLATLLVLKILATSLTIGSGGSGGVFAPSLFLGAMTGGLVGTAANLLFPGVAGSPGAYALVGMGAVVGGTTHAPITAILIIFELTSDYKLIIPLMAASIVGTLVTTLLQRESIYTMKLIRRGVDIRQGQDINVLKAVKVRDVMSHKLVKIQASQPFGEIVGELTTHPHECFYVVDPEDHLKGIIVLADLRQVLAAGEVSSDILVAADVAREDVWGLDPGQGLDAAVRVFAGKNREELPVVDPDGRLLGVLSRRHVVDAYNSEILKRDMVEGLGTSLAVTSTQEIHLGEDYRMAELDAPGEFVGRSIRDLDVRARYRAQILQVRRTSPAGDHSLELLPEPDTLVERGDRLVVVARRRDLERLRTL